MHTNVVFINVINTRINCKNYVGTWFYFSFISWFFIYDMYMKLLNFALDLCVPLSALNGI